MKYSSWRALKRRWGANAAKARAVALRYLVTALYRVVPAQAGTQARRHGALTVKSR